MAKSFPTAQEFSHRLTFASRAAVDDGYGNKEGAFEDRLTVWAALRSRGGSEAVAAARLEGQNILGVYLRSSTETRQIASDWRMTDVRTGVIYAVKVVDAATDRRFIYLEAQTGIAP